MVLAPYGKEVSKLDRNVQFRVDMTDRTKITHICGLNDGLFYQLQRDGIVNFELSDYAENQLINYNSHEPLEALGYMIKQTVDVCDSVTCIRIYKFRKPKANPKSFKKLRKPLGIYY